MLCDSYYTFILFYIETYHIITKVPRSGRAVEDIQTLWVDCLRGQSPSISNQAKVSVYPLQPYQRYLSHQVLNLRVQNPTVFIPIVRGRPIIVDKQAFQFDLLSFGIFQ